MQLKTQYEFLFVGRDEGSFLENYAYNVSEGESGSAQIFACVEIQNNPVDAEVIGETLFEAFKKSFFPQKAQKDPYLRFENSLKEINRVIDGFREAKSSGHIGRLHIIVAAVSEDNLFLSQTGDSEAYLIRKHFVSSISEGLYDSDSRETFTSIANGHLESGDFLLFASTRLLRYISKSNLTRIIQPDVVRTLNELRDSVAPEILGRIGFIGISVGLPAEKEAQEFVLLKRRMENRFAFVSDLYSKARGFMKDRLARVSARGLNDSKSASTASTFSRSSGFFSGIFWGLRDLFGNRDGMNGMTKNKILGLLIVVILLLTFGVWFVKYRQEMNAEILALDTQLAQAREQVSEAEAKGQYDKEAAAAILENAEKKVREVISHSSHRAKGSEVLALIAKTRDLLDDIRRVSDARVLADVSQKDSGVNLLGFAGSNGRFFAYSADKVFEIVLDKISEPVKVDTNEAIISATSFDERESVLLFTKAGKVFELKDDAVRQMATLDGAFRKGVAIEDWGSRLYILDPDSDQIWRYPYVKSRDVFGTAEGYKIDGSVKDSVDMAIDGSVYTLDKTNGALTRYYAGSRQIFNVQNAPFVQPQSAYRLYTDGELGFAFVLDTGDNKIYVYGKDSKSSHFVYRYQLLFEGLDSLRDVYFAQTTNQIYVMDSKKIYEVSL